LVLERGADHAVDVLVRRQGHRAGDAGAGALRRLDDLAGSAIDSVVVVRLETDPDLVCGNRGQLRLSGYCSSLNVLIAQTGRRPIARGAPPQVLCPSNARVSAGAIRAGPEAGPWSLLENLGDDPRAYGAPALADREPKALVHGDRRDELDRHLDVVSRHHHLGALRKVRNPRDVGRPEVELRAIAREERRVAAALLLLEAIDLGLELRVRGDRAGLGEHLPALDVLTLGPAEQAADVVAGLTLVQDLAEHLDAGDDGLLGRLDADDLDLVARVDDALLDPARGDRAAPGDREDVLDRHQERLVQVALRLR